MRPRSTDRKKFLTSRRYSSTNVSDPRSTVHGPFRHRVGPCRAPTLTTMPEATITKRLRAHLNEVYFVFRHLPDRLLGIASKLSAAHMRDFFVEKARAVRAHQVRLLSALMAWGERPGPCTCEEVSEQLNDLRYTAKANREPPWSLSARPGRPTGWPLWSGNACRKRCACRAPYARMNWPMNWKRSWNSNGETIHSDARHDRPGTGSKRNACQMTRVPLFRHFKSIIPGWNPRTSQRPCASERAGPLPSDG